MSTQCVSELKLTRLIDAPRNLVFEAWTNQDHLAKWWGPKMFTNPVCEADVRVGGKLKIVMRGPDGADYPMGGSFIQIVPNKKVVFTAIAFEDADGNPMLENMNTVTFEDERGKTRMNLHVKVMKAGPEVVRALEGMEEGWSGSLDKLVDLIESTMV